MMGSEIAFAVELIALASGISLLIWAWRNEGDGVALAKIFGYIISILALIAILFTILSSVFRSFEMMQMMKNGCCQMNNTTSPSNMMQNKPMMNNMPNMPGMMQGDDMNKKQNPSEITPVQKTQ